MRSASVSVRKVFLGIVLCGLVFWLSGCGAFSQLGETRAEARRRHLRNSRINYREMMEDIDTVLLFDKPCKLTSKRIP